MLSQDALQKLGKVLFDLFSLYLRAESNNKCRSKITAAISKHFKVPSEQLEQINPKIPVSRPKTFVPGSLVPPASPCALGVCSDNNLATTSGEEDLELVSSYDSSDMESQIYSALRVVI
jgi:hypothetical protein